MFHAFRTLPLLVAIAALSACGLGVGDSTNENETGNADGSGADVIETEGPSDKDVALPSSGTPSSPSAEGYVNALALGADESGAPVCSGDLATDTFRYGLCVCGDLAMAGELKTSSFHSSDPNAPDGDGGGVGVNGRYTSSGGADIGGSLVVGGKLSPVGDYEIAGELRTGGDASVVGDLHVGQDAYVAGRLVAIGMSVDGTLHTTEELGMMSWVDAGATAVSDFTVDPPCGCDDVLDIAGLVQQAASDNDNAAASLSADAFDGFAGEASVELAPGRYYLTGISAAGDIELHLSGPTALYVDGDVSLAGKLEVVLENDSAELDLFLSGRLAHAGKLELGSATAPAKVRTYVGGDGNIAIAGEAVLGGALYAPNARLVAAGEMSFHGAVLVGSVADAGRINVRYDADLMDAEQGCDPAEDPAGDDEGEDVTPVDDVGGEDGDDGDEGDEGAPPAGEGVPNDGPSSQGGECVTFEDCASPLACIEGTCIYLEG